MAERSGRRVSGQSLRDLVASSLRSREARIPDWIRQVGEEAGLTKAETDSLAVTLGRALTRLVRFRISSRTDIIVVDMAAAAHTERARAREFLKSLLLRIGEEMERAGGELSTKLESAAQAAGLSESVSGALVRTIARLGFSAYEEGEVTTTGRLVETAAREVGLSREHAEQVITVLLSADTP